MTNELAMPEFDETPGQIRSEIKISSYQSLKKNRSSDIPLADIFAYLRLHPNLPPTDSGWLFTKFYGRIAAPWTCLVVVLIAIPFGAATGRRNLFVGVAGSIFHLLRLFCDSTSRPGARFGRLSAGVAGGLAAELDFRRAGVRVDAAGAVIFNLKKVTDELAKLTKRHERLQLLYQVSNVIHSTLDSQEALQLIVSEAVRLMNASSGSVVLINPTSGFLEISASQNLPGAATKLKLRVGEGITGWVARHGKPVRVGDVTQDPRYVAARRGVKSELAVPLEVNGETRGVINVDSDRTDAFSADDQELLEQLAVQAAKVIHNTWLYEQLRLKVHLFESLASVSRTINSTLNLDEALRVITREACELMRARMCSLMMLDESREWLDLRASYGAGDAYIKKPRLNVEESLLGVVARRKKPMQVANVQTSSRYQNVEVARRKDWFRC